MHKFTHTCTHTHTHTHTHIHIQIHTQAYLIVILQRVPPEYATISLGCECNKVEELAFMENKSNENLITLERGNILPWNVFEISIQS